MEKEDLKKKREDLIKQRDQMLANYNFLSGQIQFIEELLTNKPEKSKNDK